MKIKDIEMMWSEDCAIDPLELINESIKSPKLHAKYSEILNQERQRLAALTNHVKRLKLEMRQFMVNPSRNNERGFLQGIPRGQRIIKSDYDNMIDGDPVILEEEAKLNLLKAKIEYLESIIWQIKDRKEHIRNIINLRKFEAGD